MATDVRQRLREALVTVLGAAAGVAAITGRAEGNCVQWNALGMSSLPVLVYRVTTMRENGESGQGWDAQVQITAVADGADADSIVEELLGAAEAALTAPALLAAGVDAAPMRWQRLDGSNDDQGDGDEVHLNAQGLHQSHADVELSLTS